MQRERFKSMQYFVARINKTNVKRVSFGTWGSSFPVGGGCTKLTSDVRDCDACIVYGEGLMDGPAPHQRPNPIFRSALEVTDACQELSDDLSKFIRGTDFTVNALIMYSFQGQALAMRPEFDSATGTLVCQVYEASTRRRGNATEHYFVARVKKAVVKQVDIQVGQEVRSTFAIGNVTRVCSL